MPAININLLPQNIRDIIELKESTDPTFYRFIDSTYTDWFWNWLSERADPLKQQSVILSITGSQGSGKSSAAISICAFLDPAFTVNHIFFGYNDLVYERSKLKDGTAVLVDEQSQTFGLDSHRVNVILTNLKEQLRKRSIHFVFCAPVLYPESATSMYLLEVMFIDYETQECYAALKTREGLTLGHVQIPYPLKTLEDGSTLVSEEFMKLYDKKKDVHLEKVLGRKSVDMFEERAQMLMKEPVFKRAEKIYKQQMGYIPNATCVQLVNKIYPEFGAGVVAAEIAARVKLNKELSGEWTISGRSQKKEKGGM